MDDKKFERAFPSGSWKGLTKREYFAALFMQGFISCNGYIGSPEEYAKSSVLRADALLKELDG